MPLLLGVMVQKFFFSYIRYIADIALPKLFKTRLVMD